MHHHPGRSKPYKAEVWHGGKQVQLGSFATAEEAALRVARSPEGQAAAAELAAAPAPLTSEEARQQAHAENLTLVVVAESKTGYFGVGHLPGSRAKPYQAQVSRGGKNVHLGYFATAEEAALSVARSSEGQAAAVQRAAAAERAAAAPPLTSQEARQQAQAEGLTLLVAENKAGYFGVSLANPGQPKPYQARVQRGSKTVSLGSFATAEEAALCVARSPEGQAAAAQSVAVTPAGLTGEEARQQAQAEGLTLVVAKNSAGYYGVALPHPGNLKPYQARVRRRGKLLYLGYFATAEEAALCVARTPEGQAAAEWAAPQKDNPKGNHAAMPSVAILDDLNEEGTAPPLPPGANRRGGLFLLEERARRACFLLESAGRHEEERSKRQRM